MLVKFNCKNARVYDKDREMMEKKIEKRLSRYFSNEEPEVFVKISEEKLGFKVELTLPYYGYNLRSENVSKDGLFAAFDTCLDTIERRMAKHKDKIISKKGKSEPKGEATVVDNSGENEEKYELVRVKRYEMKPMTTDEAIFNMELLGHAFYTFYSAEEGTICTVYRRVDGGYGLVVPELK